MKKYHIVFKENLDDYYSKGVNIEAEEENIALVAFRDKYPNVIFLAMYSSDILNIPSDNKNSFGTSPINPH